MWLRKLKTKNIRNIVAALLAATFFVVPAWAAAEAVAQAYEVTGSVQQGMIVQLDPHDASKVEPLRSDRASSMQGVVVNASDAAVSLSGNTPADQVYVASSGKYDVLVSTQNGPIKSGDIISISALDGVGMKADQDEAVVLGKALQSFDGQSNVSGTATLTTSQGKQNVSLGEVQVDIGISHNPLAGTGNDTAVPGFLRRFAETIAGKPVSAVRIYIGLAILLLTVAVTGSLLYAGVRNGLISIGRNPLAKGTVLRGLLQVVFVGITIFIIGLLAIYLLVKL